MTADRIELYCPPVGRTVDILSELHLVPLSAICQALSTEQRFGGWTKSGKYHALPGSSYLGIAVCNVAAHSLSVANLLAETRQHPAAVHAGLCHDLSEGCGIKDIPAPVKRELPEYAHIEWAVLVQLERLYHFDLTKWGPSVHWADMAVREAEQVVYQGRDIKALPQALRIVEYRACNLPSHAAYALRVWIDEGVRNEGYRDR